MQITHHSVSLGSVFGSILGGRYSDYQLAKMKAANGGQGYAEVRSFSTLIAHMDSDFCTEPK